MRAAFFVALLAVSLSMACRADVPSDPRRVWDSWTHRWITFNALLDGLSREQVVIVGEMHDDPATHRIERELLEGVMKRAAARPVALGLEMFERDVQTALDDYLAGRIEEAELLKRSRPWPNYARDYRPMIEAARAAKAAVVASNVPRPFAAQVAKDGAASLRDVPADRRWLVARHTSAPRDAYRERFVATMKGHAAADALDRYYAAQCLKDDTMAESIADWFERGGGDGLLIHYNGAFHSDGNLGLVSRTKERMPKARIATVRIVPVEDVAKVETARWEKAADYVIFVRQLFDL